MATKKVSNCVAVSIPEEPHSNCITSNLNEAERILKDEALVKLADISQLLFGDRDLKLEVPPNPDSVQSSSWNVYVLSNLINEVLGTIRSRI